VFCQIFFCCDCLCIFCSTTGNKNMCPEIQFISFLQFPLFFVSMYCAFVLNVRDVHSFHSPCCNFSVKFLLLSIAIIIIMPSYFFDSICFITFAHFVILYFLFCFILFAWICFHNCTSLCMCVYFVVVLRTRTIIFFEYTNFYIHLRCDCLSNFDFWY